MQLTPVPTPAPTDVPEVNHANTEPSASVSYARDWGPWWHTVTKVPERNGFHMLASWPNPTPIWGFGLRPTQEHGLTERVTASRALRCEERRALRAETEAACSAMLYSPDTPQSPIPITNDAPFSVR